MNWKRPWARRPVETRTFRRTVVQFAISGLVALLIIGVLAFVALRRESTQQSIRNAEQLTQYIATSLIEPSLTERPGILTGDTAAIAWFDERVHSRILDNASDIVRVKIWAPDGRIIYSDRAGLVGNTYELPHDAAEALEGGAPLAEVSELERPENEFDDLTGKLLEVYVPIRTQGGDQLLFETYRRYSSVDAAGSNVFGRFLPILLAGLIILGLVFAPLGWSMARQIRASQRERERLLVSAIDASDRERRRIASEVHDGPVQELAGLSFALAGAADRAGDATPPDIRRSLDESAAALRNVMRRLRGLLVEIHPPTLRASGLRAALSDLVTRLPAKGIATTLDVDQMPTMSAETEGLLFRGAQEAVRNALEHSGATHVIVSVTGDDRTIRLEVADDGRGFDADERNRRRAEGHLGLELLEDLVRDSGGHVDVVSIPEHGTRVAIVVPR